MGRRGRNDDPDFNDHMEEVSDEDLEEERPAKVRWCTEGLEQILSPPKEHLCSLLQRPLVLCMQQQGLILTPDVSLPVYTHLLCTGSQHPPHDACVRMATVACSISCIPTTFISLLSYVLC